MTPRWPSSSGTFEANAAAVSRDEIDQPTVVDLLPNCHQFWVGLRSGLPERLGHERDGLPVGAAVEDHPGSNAVVVVIGQTCLGLVVARRLDVGMVEVSACVQHGTEGHALLRRALREAIELVEVLRGAVRAQVLDELRTDVRIVRNDDDRFRGHRTMMGIFSHPRTVDVDASLMPL